MRKIFASKCLYHLAHNNTHRKQCSAEITDIRLQRCLFESIFHSWSWCEGTNRIESAFHNILWTMLSTVWCEVLPFKFYYMSAFATFLSLRLERWLISARFVSVPITNLFWRPIIFLYSLQAPGRTGWAITSWTDFDWSSSFDRNLLGQSRIWQNGQSTLEKWVEHPNQSHTMMFTLNFPCHRLCVGWCSSTLTLFLCAPYNLAPRHTVHFIFPHCRTLFLLLPCLPSCKDGFKGKFVDVGSFLRVVVVSLGSLHILLQQMSGFLTQTPLITSA